MSVPLLRNLREPPIVGRFYMVPVAHADYWCGIKGDLPVLGPAHTDVEHFNFAHRHYHVDVRFLRFSERQAASRWYGDEHIATGSLPLSNAQTIGIPSGRPKLARRRCSTTLTPYRHHDKPSVIGLAEDYGEPDAVALADGRKLCPHRKVDLSSFQPDANGYVTCPLHGLRVRCA